MKTPMKKILTALAVAIGLTTAASAAGTADENGIVPYNWITFNDLTPGAIASGTSAANQGSHASGMTLPAGTAVDLGDGDIAWQFGSTSSSPNFAPSSSLRPTTYVTKLNLNGGSYGNTYRKVWGSNGQAYSGVGLCVSGTASGAYTVQLVKHSGGNRSSTLYSYSVPVEKETGFHSYAIAIDSDGKGCRFYVDGVEQYSTTSAPFTPNQNSMFGWGQLSNAGSNSSVANGLQISDFRIYTQTLTAAQIAKIAGVSGKTYKATLTDGETPWEDIGWDPALEGELGDLDEFEITGMQTEEAPVLLFSENVTLANKLTLKGDAITVKASDDFYEDGCWIKNFATFGALVCDTEPNFADVLDGFTGAYAKTANGFTLRAQNKEVISINFANGNSVSGTGYTGLAPVQGNTWMNMTTTWASGGKTVDLGTIKVTADGATTTEREKMSGSCYAANTYGYDATDVFLKGYLDDGGNHAQVNVDGIPYSTYDLIIYGATDTSGRGFDGVSVNGTTYTCGSDGVAEQGDAKWGQSLVKTAQYGVNAMIVKDLSLANLAIVGGSNSGSKGTRGGIAAIQIVCTGDVVEEQDFTATVTGEEVTFSEIDWDGGEEFVPGPLNTATITIGEGEGEFAITFDNTELTLKTVKIVSEERDVRLVAEAPLANVSTVDVSDCAGKVTYEWPVTALASGADENVYYAGGTKDDTKVAIAHNGGVLNLAGGEWTLGQSHSSTATTVNMTDITASYPESILGIGMATYTVGGESSIETPKFILVQGAANRTSVFTLKDTASVTVTGDAEPVDSNQNTIMFGHWAGDSTFTIQDDAAFTAESATILVGKTGGSHTINVDGGTITALGIKASASASGKNVLNLNGGSLVLGEYGISSYSSGRTIAVYVTVDSTITSSAAMPITQAITVDEDKTLTLDASAGDITISGTLVNNGTVSIVGGTVVFLPGAQDGEITAEGEGKAIYGYVVTVNDMGKFKIPEGKSADDIVLFDHAGNSVEITGSDETYVYFDAFPLYGTTCLMEYLFQGNLKSTGSDTGSMQFDGTHCFTGDEYVMEIVTNVVEETEVVTTNYYGIKAASAPWRNVSFPSEVTVVMYGKVMKTDNTCQIGIGSTTAGSKYSLFLASGDVEKNEVKLCYAYNNYNKGEKAVEDSGVLCTMTVPYAQTADHLYAFTLKQVGDDTVVNIYLDGEVLQPYTFAGKTVKLGSGIQLGSIHGGIGLSQNWPDAFGFKRSTAVETDATLQFVRVYDVVLNDEVMRQMAEDSPYDSPAGSFKRTLAGDAVWTTEENTWTKGDDEEPLYAKPDNGSVVTITPPADDATLTVNLGETETFESMTIEEGASVTFAKGEGTDGKVAVSGRVTAKADVTFNYDAFSMANAPLTVKAGKKVTFDLSMVDMTQFFSTQTYDLTGYATLEEDATVTCTVPEELYGREISAGIDPNTKHYIVTVTAPEQPFTYTSDGWKWGDQGVTAEIVSNNTAVAIEVQSDLEWPIDRSVFTVTDGTLKAADKPAANCAIAVNGGVLDLNGNGGTKYAISLNGGTLANAGSGAYVTGFAVGAESSVDVPDGKKLSVQSSADGWDPTTITLGENTLVKTGEGDFILVATTIDGAGTLDIQAGKVYSSESVTFTNGTIKIGAGATYQQRDGERTTKVAKIVGAGGTLNNEGTMSAFALEGTLTLKNTGAYGVITMAEGSLLNAGNQRHLALAGTGTVNAVLTDDEIASGADISVFIPQEESNIACGTFVDKDGNDVPGTFEGGIIKVSHEARIGTVYYLTLQDALNAGGDVTLLKSITAEVEIPADTTVTLDLNGQTLTAPAGRQAINNRGTLTIDNGSVTAGEAAIVFWGNSTTTVNGGTYTSTDNAVLMGSGNDGEGNASLTVNGGTFNGSITTAGYIACGVYVPNSGTYLIKGGTFNIRGGCGVCARAGTTKVDSAATFNVTGTGTGWVGDKATQVPCVAAYFDWTIPPYPGYAEGDTVWSQSNTLTTDAEQEWSKDQAEGYYMLQVKSGLEPVTPGEPAVVEAETEQEALDKVTIVAESPDPEIVSTEDYTAYFKKVAIELPTQPGKWMVAAVLTDEIVQATEPTADLADGLGDIAAGATSVEVTNAKPGLYYSVKYTDDVTGIATADEGDRAMAQADGSVTIDTPVVEESTKMFYQIQVNTSAE